MVWWTSYYWLWRRSTSYAPWVQYASLFRYVPLAINYIYIVGIYIFLQHLWIELKHILFQILGYDYRSNADLRGQTFKTFYCLNEAITYCNSNPNCNGIKDWECNGVWEAKDGLPFTSNRGTCSWVMKLNSSILINMKRDIRYIIKFFFSVKSIITSNSFTF